MTYPMNYPNSFVKLCFSYCYIISSCRFMWHIYPYSSGLIYWKWGNRMLTTTVGVKSPWWVWVKWLFMNPSSSGNIFRVIGPLLGESTCQRWIPLKKASDWEFWCFLWSTPEQTVEQTTETPVIWEAIALIMTSWQYIQSHKDTTKRKLCASVLAIIYGCTPEAHFANMVYI